MSQDIEDMVNPHSGVMCWVFCGDIRWVLRLAAALAEGDGAVGVDLVVAGAVVGVACGAAGPAAAAGSGTRQLAMHRPTTS